ncbi:hypothetical protein [Glutamicibacter sp. HZAU]|uniref:hypothetical protein n=1 Tax=Glutamicibacter sp. HZAU TaxID=2049891 RepID=UPI000FFBF191|nr:hypothetical protein [Glutamicibacter sp. HZAU]RWZ79852.1 hypothetical protein EKH49_15265 [Glutamicibacter sp. HZAU]
MNKHEWGTNQLRRLGESIRDETEPRSGTPDYVDVMSYFNDYADEIRQKIQVLDWTTLLSDREYEVSSRPKTIDTLRQKLQRDRRTPLQSIQDIAGIRFEAEMTLLEQDAVVTAIAGMFDENEVQIRDLRSEPHSGYRAVHLWLKEPARAEIQVRTQLQGKWANMYEAAADVLGREIRYGVMPTHPNESRTVLFLHAISSAIAELERRYSVFHVKDLSIDQRPKFSTRYTRMRKKDLRRRNRINDIYVRHERERLLLKRMESRIALDCDEIREQFEGLRRMEEGKPWLDS